MKRNGIWIWSISLWLGGCTAAFLMIILVMLTLLQDIGDGVHDPLQTQARMELMHDNR